MDLTYKKKLIKDAILSAKIKVLVQDFKDYAEMELMGSSLHASEELTISTTPVVYRSSENIRDLDPRKRQCLFRNEVQTSGMSLKQNTFFSNFRAS